MLWWLFPWKFSHQSEDWRHLPMFPLTLRTETVPELGHVDPHLCPSLAKTPALTTRKVLFPFRFIRSQTKLKLSLKQHKLYSKARGGEKKRERSENINHISTSCLNGKKDLWSCFFVCLFLFFWFCFLEYSCFASCVSFCCTTKWVSYIYPFFLWVSFPFRSPQSIE